MFAVAAKVGVGTAAGRYGLESAVLAIVGVMIGAGFLRARRPGRFEIAFNSRMISETLPLRLFPSRPMNPVPLHREQLGFTPLQVQSDIPYKLYRTDEKRQAPEIPVGAGEEMVLDVSRAREVM